VVAGLHRREPPRDVRGPGDGTEVGQETIVDGVTGPVESEVTDGGDVPLGTARVVGQQVPEVATDRFDGQQAADHVRVRFHGVDSTESGPAHLG
jgi:hypothetical protein